jgi:hypothetical protein
MIKFFDNKVPFFIRERINHASFSCPYTLGWKDLPSEEPNLHSNWSHENLAQFHILPYIQKCISQTRWFDSPILETIIINLVRSDDVHYIHHHVEKQIALYYINLDWRDGWHGETLFYSPKNIEKIIFTSVFKPGRILLFDGKVPHAIRPQSRKGPKYRMTLSLVYGKK